MYVYLCLIHKSVRFFLHSFPGINFCPLKGNITPIENTGFREKITSPIYGPYTITVP